MDGLPIIVREKKATLIIGILNVVIFSVMLIGAVMVWLQDRDSEAVLLGAGFMLFLLMGIYAMMEYYRHRIVIDDEKVQYISTFGKITQINIADIGKISYPYSGFIKICKIYDKSNKLVISFELIMTNSYEALQYLDKATASDEDEEADGEDEDGLDDNAEDGLDEREAEVSANAKE